MKNSTRGKCQAIWLKAMDSPIELAFPDRTTLERARLALYDATRKASDTRLADCRKAIEIKVSRKDLKLIVQRKDLNPFHDTLENELDKALDATPKQPLKAIREKAMDANEITQESLEDSLKRFQERMCNKDNEESRPETPYFKRED